MSPFVSWSARLQSIIPAPVRSRSSLTSAAEISAIPLLLCRDDSRVGLRSAFALRVTAGRDGDGVALALRVRLDLHARLRHLDLGCRLGLGSGRTAVLLLCEVARRDLLLALVDRLCDHARDEPAR